MTRRKTFSDLVWPDDDGDLAVKWADENSSRILNWTWKGFEAFITKHVSKVDLSQPLEQLERDLVRHHFVEIQLIFAQETDGFASVVPQHEWPELESTHSPKAKPPSYDLAFIATANQRWAWPIEAKVLKTPGTLAEYLKDVKEKFLAGVASPKVGQGAMMAYLLKRDSAPSFFQNLESQLGQTLTVAAEFKQKAHRVSEHARELVPHLHLHHLALVCVSGYQGNQ